jgi:predicted amino acid-binding ACT domain protein
MMILRGHFAMMPVVSGAAGSGVANLEAELVPVAARLDLQLNVRGVAEAVTAAVSKGERWSTAMYGADRPGLVACVSEVLATRDVNIVGLETRVIGEPDPVYAMHFELQVPAGTASQVEADLRVVARELGVEVNMHPNEADIL